MTTVIDTRRLPGFCREVEISTDGSSWFVGADGEPPMLKFEDEARAWAAWLHPFANGLKLGQRELEPIASVAARVAEYTEEYTHGGTALADPEDEDIPF